MAGDFAIPPDGCVFLDFDERTNFGVIADATAIQIDKIVQNDIAAQRNRGGDISFFH
jgi:hypothetical protein